MPMEECFCSNNKGHVKRKQARRYREIQMVTGEFRNQVDRIWHIFLSGGVTNPLSVIEQTTYFCLSRDWTMLRPTV